MEFLQNNSIVLLVGPSGAGKSTFAARHFKVENVFSSDAIREELYGSFMDQRDHWRVFQQLALRVARNCMAGNYSVVDATNLRPANRAQFASLAAGFRVPLVYIVIDRPLREKIATQGWRKDVPGLIEKHHSAMQAQLPNILRGDGEAEVYRPRL